MYKFNAAGFEVQVALARGSSRGSILQLLPQARVNISAPILQGQYCSCHRMQLLPCTKPSALQHGHWPWRNSIRDNYLVHTLAMHIIWATVGAFVLQYSDHQQCNELILHDGEIRTWWYDKGNRSLFSSWNGRNENVDILSPQVPVDTLNGLLGDKEALRKVLLRHVIPGRWAATFFFPIQTLMNMTMTTLCLYLGSY